MIALRRRPSGVDQISISQSQQTAVVTFLPGARVFAAAAFREAVAEADVDVLDAQPLELDVITVRPRS